MRTWLLLCAVLAGRPTLAAPFVWPISGTTTPDLMNTSFGPRENYSLWDFHDGIDLPAAIGTTCYAVCDATVFRAGPAGTDNYSSRHLVLRTVAPDGSTLFINYIHLSAIDPSATTLGASVVQGQRVAFVGDDDASYSHCHFEIRKQTNFESSSMHPLHWMPYTDSLNFAGFSATRFNRSGTLLTGRVEFGAGSKEEGDLKRVEVDLMNGGALLGTRTVEFDNKATIQEGPGEEYEFTNDIAVEGYQTSNMILAGYPDLSYGILVRDLPANCTALVPRVMDLAGRTTTGAAVAVPMTQTAFDESWKLNSQWSALTSSSGTGTTVLIGTSPRTVCLGDAILSLPGFTCIDSSTTGGLQQACATIALPPGRLEWMTEGWFNPATLNLAPAAAVYLLEFTAASNLSIAALIYNPGSGLYATLAALNPNGSYAGTTSSAYVSTGEWRHWRLELIRVGTRETTGILYLDQIERARLSWSSSVFEPDAVRAGIGLISGGATATIYADSLRVTELHHPAYPLEGNCSSLPCASCPPPTGDALEPVELDHSVVGPEEPPCVTFSQLPLNARVDIYTPSGRLVRHLEPSFTVARWCLDTESGRPVVRGVYLALVRSGGHRRTMKLFLRR